MIKTLALPILTQVLRKVIITNYEEGGLKLPHIEIRVITKLPNSEQSYKGKVKTHNYINRQNQSTTGKL